MDILLRLDARDVPHLLWYTGSSTQDLRYATRGTGGWQVVTVEATGNAGQHHGLTLDASGVPHACYTRTESSRTVLRLTTPGSTGWTATTVPVPDGRPNGACSLAFNSSGSLSILFGTLYGVGLGAMYLVTRTDDMGWTTFIEDDFYVYDSALAFDSGGHPHFLYYGRPYDGSGHMDVRRSSASPGVKLSTRRRPRMRTKSLRFGRTRPFTGSRSRPRAQAQRAA